MAHLSLANLQNKYKFAKKRCQGYLKLSMKKALPKKAGQFQCRKRH